MKNALRILAVFASLVVTSAVFGMASVTFSLTAGQTIQIDLQGTTDSSIRVIDTNTNQVVADASLLTAYPGSYSSNYYGYSYSTIPGVTFDVAGTSVIAGLPAGNYKLEVESAGCTGSSASYGYFFILQDWSYAETMDYTVSIY